MVTMAQGGRRPAAEIRDPEIEQALAESAAQRDPLHELARSIECGDLRHGLVLDPDRLYRARVARGVTRREVVDRLALDGIGATLGDVRRWERGIVTPPADALLALGQALGVTLGALTACWRCACAAAALPEPHGTVDRLDAARVRAARQAAGLSVLGAAARAGVERRDAVAIERGRGGPVVFSVVSLYAKACGLTSQEQFALYTDEPAPDEPLGVAPARVLTGGAA